MVQSIRKRNLAVMSVLTLAFLFAVFSGCSAAGRKTNAVQEQQGFVNQSFDETKALLTVGGESVLPDDERLSLLPQLGFGVLLPETWSGFADALTFVAVEQGICVGFLPPSVMKDLESMSEAEIEAFDFASLYANQLPLIKILFEDSEKGEEAIKAENRLYQSLDKIASLDGKTYYIAYNDTISDEGNPEFKPSDIEAFETLAASIPEIKEGIAIFPIQKSPDGELISDESLRSLEAVDMNGNKVTADIFSAYDLTMINIWATWCGPCVDEMPDLAELYRTLPNNVNLITICVDGAEESETAKQVLQRSDAGFVTLSGDEELKNGLLANIVGYPTTIFVDSNGTVVGDPFVGAWPKEGYEREIEKRLAQLG